MGVPHSGKPPCAVSIPISPKHSKVVAVDVPPRRGVGVPQPWRSRASCAGKLRVPWWSMKRPEATVVNRPRKTKDLTNKPWKTHSETQWRLRIESRNHGGLSENFSMSGDCFCVIKPLWCLALLGEIQWLEVLLGMTRLRGFHGFISLIHVVTSAGAPQVAGMGPMGRWNENTAFRDIKISGN